MSEGAPLAHPDGGSDGLGSRYRWVPPMPEGVQLVHPDDGGGSGRVDARCRGRLSCQGGAPLAHSDVEDGGSVGLGSRCRGALLMLEGATLARFDSGDDDACSSALRR